MRLSPDDIIRAMLFGMLHETGAMAIPSDVLALLQDASAADIVLVHSDRLPGDPMPAIRAGLLADYSKI